MRGAAAGGWRMADGGCVTAGVSVDDRRDGRGEWEVIQVVRIPRVVGWW